MDEKVAHALHLLEQAEQRTLAELAGLRLAILQLREPLQVPAAPHRGPYSGLGIVDATTRWLTAVGEPRTTREIADALQDGGLDTKSKKFVATVYATLKNSPKVRRTGNGAWALPESEQVPVRTVPVVGPAGAQ